VPTISRTVTASAQDVLTGLKFKNQTSPALVSLYASSATAGDDLSFSVDSQEFCAAAEINLEIANQAVDLQRDGLLLQERVPAGEYFLAITVTTDVSFRLIIEPVPVGI